MRKYEDTIIDDCASPDQMSKEDLIVVRHPMDNAVCGFRCKICDGWWKIYQNEYHSKDCKYKSRDGV